MSRVEAHLEDEFGRADADHFAWQTSHAVASVEEATLVRDAFLPLGERVLDLGCAEGATLHHLGGPRGAVGVDLFEAKLAFARARLPACSFVRGSAYDLPFEAGSFDDVLVRDVIHHMDDPARAMREIARVLRPGGTLKILEPCRYNPLILLHAASNRAERGELRSTATFLRTVVAAGDLAVEQVGHRQALPLHRVVFHPILGAPSLARFRSARALVQLGERIAERVMPRATWAYLVLRARKAG